MNIEKLMNIRGIIEQELANERVILWCFFSFKYENMPKDLCEDSIKEVFDSCGTTACIAGWTILTYKPDLNFDYTNRFYKGVFKTAQEILELTDNEAIYLFKAGVKQDALTRFDNLLHASTFKGELK